MNITLRQAELCKQFHNEWFTKDNIKKGRKPNNITALNGVTDSNELQNLKNILSLYYFKFWRIKFADVAPPIQQIVHEFKQYK